MPKSIPVAVVTNSDGTHLDNFLPSLASIDEVESVYPSDERTLQHEVAWGPKEVPYGPACGCRQTRTLA